MVGSLSKAFSCLGAFVTCTHELKTILKMASSTYIFGGPVAPAYLEGICTVCDILMSDEYDRIAENLRQRIRRLVDGLRDLDLVVLGNDSAIVSVLVKDRARAMHAGKWLFDRGFYVAVGDLSRRPDQRKRPADPGQRHPPVRGHRRFA